MNPDAGLNLRLGFTSYALDATINPDFSQVESDAGQVTVNERFALFFPEKRPFFLEGIELFGSPQTLVYTRRIVDPKAGAKLTGKFGQLGVAHLTARGRDRRRRRLVQHHPAPARLRPQLDRRASPSPTATRATPTTGCSPATSATSGACTTPSSSTAGPSPATRPAAGPRRSGRRSTTAPAARWGFNYLLNGLGRRVRRPGGLRQPAPEQRGQRARLQPAHPLRRPRRAAGEPHRVLRSGAHLALRPRSASSPALEGVEQVDATFQLRGGWELNGHVERDFVNFQDCELRRVHRRQRRRPGLPAGRRLLRASSGSTKVTTPTWRQLERRRAVPARAGRDLPGGRDRHGLAADRRAGPAARCRRCGWRSPAPCSGSTGWTAREFARSTIPRLKVEYQPNRALFFRAIGEYRSERTGGAGRPGDRRAAVRRRGGRSRPPSSTASGWTCSPRSSRRRGRWRSWATAARSRPTSEFNWRRLSRGNDGFFVKLAYQYRQ